MKHIEVYGQNYAGYSNRSRTTARAVVIDGGKILLSYLTKNDLYMTPGGGLEGDESPSEACAREVEEETGLRVEVGEEFAICDEFYENWHFESHFFLCKVIDSGEKHFTEQETAQGLETRWLELGEARAIFASHPTILDYEEKRGIYEREHKALEALLG